MYIYKITVVPLNQCYIGFDTSPSYKLARWKVHCKNAAKSNKPKLYEAMSKYGIKQCLIEVLEDNFTSITALALAEINYIKLYNSFNSGLNSTCGGDGLGRHILHQLSNEDIASIKNALGDRFKEYNTQVKWANTSIEDRKSLTSHLHTVEVYRKKSETLKKFYEHYPEEKEKKKSGIMQWQRKNRELLCETNRKNSLKGAAKVSKKLQVEFPNGDVLYYPSKSEFSRQTGQWPNTIIRKTNEGLSHNGYRAWEQ
jgi:hypothetical protein